MKKKLYYAVIDLSLSFGVLFFMGVAVWHDFHNSPKTDHYLLLTILFVVISGQTARLRSQKLADPVLEAESGRVQAH